MAESQRPDLHTAAEIDKLASEISLSEGSLAALSTVDGDNIRRLRQGLAEANFKSRDRQFSELAALTNLLPKSYLAKLAQNCLGPLFAARVVSHMHPVSAAKTAKLLDPAFLAEAAALAHPGRVRAILPLIPAELIRDVALLLVEREDYILMGRFADAISAPALRLVVNAVEDDGVLLKIAYYMEERSQLSKVVMMIDNDRIARIMQTGTEKDLWPQALSVIDNVNPELTGRLANIMGDQDEAVLDNLVQVAYERCLWGPVLRGMAAMHPKYYRKIVNLPSLKDKTILSDLVKTAYEEGLLATALPLAKVMRPEFQKVVAEAALHQGDDVAEAALWAAQNSSRWDVILDLAQHMDDEERNILARLPIAQNRQVLKTLLSTAAGTGQMGLLLDFAKRFNETGLRMVVDIGLEDSGDLLETILDAADRTDNGWDAVATAVAAVEDEATLQQVAKVYRQRAEKEKAAFKSAASSEGIWDRLEPILEAA